MCPPLCTMSPCDCNGEDEDPNCNICHLSGCGQCAQGYFKLSNDYPCVQCQESVGVGCMFWCMSSCC